mgnify:CR=1 FL=1
MAEFKESLKRGKQIERMVLHRIQKKYPKSFIKEGYCKEWDIYIPEKGFGIEVKCDEKSNYTGNFVVEVEFGGKPSALSTTKSKYWVFFDGNEFIYIEPNILKNIIKKYKIAKFIGEGDKKYKKAYLVKKGDIINNAIYRESYKG